MQESKRAIIHIRLSESLKKRAAKAVDHHNLSITGFIKMLIVKELERLEI